MRGEWSSVNVMATESIRMRNRINFCSQCGGGLWFGVTAKCFRLKFNTTRKQSKYFFLSDSITRHLSEQSISMRWKNYDSTNHDRNSKATHKNNFDTNCSSSSWAVPLTAETKKEKKLTKPTTEEIPQFHSIEHLHGGRGSPMLNVCVKKPNGNAPMPNDMLKLESPKPNPWNPGCGSGSTRWPAGRGGTFVRGSCWFVLPRPYNGMTFSLLIAALHTGHNCRVGRVSSHWCKHGQQNRCPHKLTTASLAVSKHMLHSNIESSFLSSPSVLLFSLVSGSVEVVGLGSVSMVVGVGLLWFNGDVEVEGDAIGIWKLKGENWEKFKGNVSEMTLG